MTLLPEDIAPSSTLTSYTQAESSGGDVKKAAAPKATPPTLETVEETPETISAPKVVPTTPEIVAAPEAVSALEAVSKTPETAQPIPEGSASYSGDSLSSRSCLNS